MIDVEKIHGVWRFVQDGDVIGLCKNMTYLEALDAFRANWPEHGDALDALRRDHVDLWGAPAAGEAKRPRVASGAPRAKRGSGARFRELILGGASNAEALAKVRAEFPESKASLSDAAWNRAELRKDPMGFAPDGTRLGPKRKAIAPKSDGLDGGELW